VTATSAPLGPGPRVPRPTTTPTGDPVGTTTARRVVVLISGVGSNLAALLAAHDDVTYAARVVGVVSDNPAAGGLDVARAAGIPTAVVAPRDFADRASWDRGLAETVRVFRPELVVSAGFMRILGASFLAQFPARVLNTHPALLPSFPGAHAVRDALAHGVKVTGCTVHVVDDGVDTGPIIAQRAVEITADDDEDGLHERIKEVERALLVDVVGRIAREGMTIEGRQVHVGAPGPR
jgi:phosphoribosylglycinamide formyltransferase 1